MPKQIDDENDDFNGFIIINVIKFLINYHIY